MTNCKNGRNFKYMSELDSLKVTPLTQVKRRAIKTAKELFYDNECLEALISATTENEITRIMKAARERCFA